MNGYINRYIIRLSALLMLMLCIFIMPVVSAEDTPSDLGFSAIIGCAWRDISGTLQPWDLGDLELRGNVPADATSGNSG